MRNYFKSSKIKRILLAEDEFFNFVNGDRKMEYLMKQLKKLAKENFKEYYKNAILSADSPSIFYDESRSFRRYNV